MAPTIPTDALVGILGAMSSLVALGLGVRILTGFIR